MAKYATKEQVRDITSPVDDLTVGDLTYRLAAITRGDYKWASDEVGYATNDGTGAQDSVDADRVDMLMLAISLVEPDFDPSDEADIVTLQEMPIGVSSKLIKKMMELSGLAKEDPTAQTDE